MYMFVYVHVQGMTDSEGKKETTLSYISLGRHDFIYVPTPQCCYYALLTESV